LRPLRGREPEGLWNLLSIVREMFRRNDENALHLLEVLTEEAIACDQVGMNIDCYYYLFFLNNVKLLFIDHGLVV